MASRRIERVLCQSIEEVDWEQEGVQRGDIDTVVLCDVLEHIYDPWKTLLTLRNLVSPTAQFLLSIPNVRNAPLIQDLISGHWRYRKAGLLDITHIRFFTRQDMYRMFYQTGFRVVATRFHPMSVVRGNLPEAHQRRVPAASKPQFGIRNCSHPARSFGPLYASARVYYCNPSNTRICLQTSAHGSMHPIRLLLPMLRPK